MRKELTAALAASLLLAGPVSAQERQGRPEAENTDEMPVQTLKSLDQVVYDSIAYANIGPGLVLIEDSISSSICRIYSSDAVFDAWAAGEESSEPGRAICVPTTEFGGGLWVDEETFDDLINFSIGYVNVAPGQVLIESDGESHICRFRVTDDYFEAYAEGDTTLVPDPEITCVPLTEFEN